MDAIHYDKIADKLIQFHSKLPDTVDLESNHAIYTVEYMKRAIDALLQNIDSMAKLDENGWLR